MGPSLRLRLASLVLACALALVLASPASAESLHVVFPQSAEVTVVQGSSAPFTLEVEAYGATRCSATTAPVVIDTLYSVDAVGDVASGDPGEMPITTTEHRGSSDNCYIETPVQVALTATAAPGTPVGDYTSVVRYGKGGRGVVDLDGPALTIHVVAPPAQPEPEALPEPELTPPEILVLGEREVALRPTYGKTQLLKRVKGTVRVRMPGKTAFVLGDPILVPNGTVVDATNGVVKVTVERSPKGGLETADAWGGAFRTNQIRGLTTFRLHGKLAAARKGASAARTAKRKKRSRRATRRLWVNGKGNFQTRGRRASAIVRGTFWLTEETASTTKVSVKRGLVAVRDYVRKRTVLVGQGKSYTARERIARIRRAPAFTGRHRG